MKIQELIGEVAKRHNVLVDPTDPVFIAVTLNELLLEEHVAKLDVALRHAERTIADLSARQVKSAKWIAAALIADTSTTLAAELRAAGPSLGKGRRSVLLGSAGPCPGRIERPRAPGAAVLSMVAGTCLLVGVAIGFWMGQH